jgi:hypothetical protein
MGREYIGFPCALVAAPNPVQNYSVVQRLARCRKGLRLSNSQFKAPWVAETACEKTLSTGTGEINHYGLHRFYLWDIIMTRLLPAIFITALMIPRLLIVSVAGEGDRRSIHAMPE